MKTLAKLLLFTAVALLTVDRASAGEIYEFYNGVRALGMGGAYVTTANDETALFTNPAGLGKLRDPFFTLADPEIGTTQNVTNYVAFSNVLDLMSAQGLVSIMQNKPGKHVHFQAQVSPSIVIPNFGFGLIAKWQSDVDNNAAGDTLTMNYRNDYGAALGYNFRIFDGVLKFGFSGKFIDRIEVRDKTFPSTTTGLTFKQISSEGTGISTDAGMILTAPVALLPALGVNVRDVGGTSFNMTDGVFYTTTTRPQYEPQKVDAGLSISPIFGNHVRGTFAAEVHDVLTKDALEKTDIMRRFHAGLELNVADFFFLRGGWNQKSWTTGFEFASEKFQLQGALYGEDIGTPNAPIIERRMMGKFSLRF